jgi:glyoxylase I family protein
LIKGIEHTAIASLDPERLADWYVANLGFVIHFRPPNSKACFLKAPDGSMIEVIEAAPGTSAVSGMEDAGLRHLALLVDDFDTAYTRLRSQGVAFLTEPRKFDGNSVVFFRDCDGNILHLLHRVNPL